MSDAEAHLARITSGMSDFVNPFEGELTPVRRGEYIVRHVAGCMECHTPRKLALAFDETKLLSGIDNLFDVAPQDDTVGLLHSPNLTPDPETGIGLWTDDEIKRAFLDGVNPQGVPLSPMMPYFVFHNMTGEDADAIVLYLRSIPPVYHLLPKRQPLPVPLTAPANPVPVAAFPATTLAPSDARYASATRGQYLTTSLSPCIFCHTEENAPGAPDPVKLDKLLLGHRAWSPTALGDPADFGGPRIFSKNLTPTTSGLESWTPDDVAAAVRWGRDRGNGDICEPMPSGAEGSFGLMLDQDAKDIGTYLTTLAPKDNGNMGDCCTSCHTRDGGTLNIVGAGGKMPALP